MSSSPDDKAFTSAELGKNQTEHIDHVDSHGSDASQDAVAAFGYSPQEQRKLIHRIDRRLVVTVGVMYCISLMDRTNLSAANIAGYGSPIEPHHLKCPLMTPSMSVELDMVKGYRYVSTNAESPINEFD